MTARSGAIFVASLMRKLRLNLALVVTVWTAPYALAAPTAFYNPVTGNVQILNDTEVSLIAISILSPSGLLGTPDALLPVPGAHADKTEFPFAYIYSNFPTGLYDTGNTVIVGTPVSELVLDWTNGIGSTIQGRVVEVPEPASLILASLPVLAAIRWRKRFAG